MRRFKTVREDLNHARAIHKYGDLEETSDLYQLKADHHPETALENKTTLIEDFEFRMQLNNFFAMAAATAFAQTTYVIIHINDMTSFIPDLKADSLPSFSSQQACSNVSELQMSRWQRAMG